MLIHVAELEVLTAYQAAAKGRCDVDLVPGLGINALSRNGTPAMEWVGCSTSLLSQSNVQLSTLKLYEFPFAAECL